jgi:hypothetical protein
MAIRRWHDRFNASLQRAWDAIRFNWYLGFTSFGGPPVHFKIVCDFPHDVPSTTIHERWMGI